MSCCGHSEQWNLWILRHCQCWPWMTIMGVIRLAITQHTPVWVIEERLPRLARRNGRGMPPLRRRSRPSFATVVLRSVNSIIRNWSFVVQTTLHLKLLERLVGDTADCRMSGRNGNPPRDSAPQLAEELDERRSTAIPAGRPETNLRSNVLTLSISTAVIDCSMKL